MYKYHCEIRYGQYDIVSYGNTVRELVTASVLFDGTRIIPNGFDVTAIVSWYVETRRFQRRQRHKQAGLS